MACNTSEGSREPAPPPNLGQKKKRTQKEEKLAGQAKQNQPSSRSETATEYAYKHYFFMASNSSSQNVVFVSVLHIIMQAIIMNNHLRT